MIITSRSSVSNGPVLRRPYSAIPIINRDTTTVQKKNLQFTVNGESCSLQERPSNRASFCSSSKARRRLMQEGPETQREKKRERFVQEVVEEPKGHENVEDFFTAMDFLTITPSETHKESASWLNSSVPENCDDNMDDSFGEVYGRPSTPEPWAMKLPHRPISCKNPSVPRTLHLYLPNLPPEEDEERKPNKWPLKIFTRRGDLNSGKSQQEGRGMTSLFQNISGPDGNLEMQMNGYKVMLAPKQPESMKLLSRPCSAKEKHTNTRHILPPATFMLHFMSPDRYEWSPAAYNANGRASSSLNKEEQQLDLGDLLKESDNIRLHESENRRHIRNRVFKPKNATNLLKIKTLEFGSFEPPNTKLIPVMPSDHFNNHDHDQNQICCALY